MTDVDDWYDDERGDWTKEEPDCPTCCDTGYTGRRNCASCNPTRVQQVWWRLTWRFRWWRIRAWLLPARSTDEAPF